MRALITGVTGFVGKYLANHLISLGYEVWGTTRTMPTAYDNNKLKLIQMNYNDVDNIVTFINQLKPDHIYHLAGQSSVKLSWNDIQGTYHANVSNTINILEAIRKSDVASSVKVLTVGSSEEYGRVANVESPINELIEMNPISPYGLTKAAVYMLVRQYSNAHQLQIVHARPFNHIGPGQSLGFVTSDFAHQIARIETGQIPSVINVGNLEAQRDFSDVRDIVVAYEKLLNGATMGEAYNVCSEKPISIKDILMKYIELSTCSTIEIKEDSSKMRPSDIPVYVGDSSKINQKLGWENQIELEQSLKDILDYWRTEISP